MIDLNIITETKEEKIKIMTEEVYQKTLNYFNLWKNKDIDNLINLFSDDIVLKDWNGKWESKSNVIEVNKNIFLNDIKLKVLLIDVCLNTSYCTLEIIVNGETISVLDVIEFNEENLICKITAYKG
jgi:hypothetical protein